MKQIELKLETATVKRQIKNSEHRSKYPALRGLDSIGHEYSARYAKLRRLLTARPSKQKKFL